MRELSLNNCRLDMRYDIHASLGRGSYAEIYVAHDTLSSPQSPHNTVVIKALNVFLQDDLDSELERTLVENFQNEAMALDRVRHPNMISRLGHGTARDLQGTVFHYLVLEYLPGGDLHKLCRDRNLSVKQALSYVEQICAGLRHAHRNGIIHRDIKPQNLLLTRDLETVKIADFGVARIHQTDSPITRVGTNIYAPPEHSPMLAGQTGGLSYRELTPSADIYSLAKSMYTLMTCESPRYFANQTIDTLPLACRDEPWAEEFLRVIKRATQSDPSSRHQSVDEFWGDLTAFREIVEEGESATLIRAKASALPQPHVSRGYSPLAPVQPHFNTSRDLRVRHPLIPNIAATSRSAEGIDEIISNQPHKDDDWDEIIERSAPEIQHDDPPVAVGPVRRRRFRRAVVFFMFLAIFGGALYGTGVYLRNSGIIAAIRNPFRVKTATANTDIFLRPEPNTNNDPIGLVTKNSKMRIVNTQNNWYQVDVIAQGRERASTLTGSHGWLNGKYIDIDDN